MQLRIFCSGLALILSGTAAAMAQSPVPELNQKAVTLLAGEAQWFARSVAIAQDLQNHGGLNVIPMQATGCIDATAHAMQLTAVDVALISSDCVDYAASQALLPKPLEKLAYIARVASLPVLLVTRRENATLTSLAGKRIATGPANSAGFASGELLLGGIGLPFVRVAQSGSAARTALETGTADAILVTGTAELSGLDPRMFHVLGLTPPNDETLHYAPAIVAAEQLAGLATSDVETVATALLLAVYNWPAKSGKAARLDLFAREYITLTAETDDASQLSATVGGWQRYRGAQNALDALTPKNTSMLQPGGTQ